MIESRKVFTAKLFPLFLIYVFCGAINKNFFPWQFSFVKTCKAHPLLTDKDLGFVYFDGELNIAPFVSGNPHFCPSQLSFSYKAAQIDLSAYITYLHGL